MRRSIDRLLLFCYTGIKIVDDNNNNIVVVVRNRVHTLIKSLVIKRSLSLHIYIKYILCTYNVYIYIFIYI